MLQVKKTLLYLACMIWYEELTKTIAAAVKQLTTSANVTPRNVDSSGIHFTNLCLARMKRRGLTEKDAIDVYFHGSVIKPNMMIRKYNGYEIGIWFFNDHLTGQAIITSIWKRERR